jgi:TetR/AcrR family transcriptional regulator, transcriptional repressor for nem operon
MSDTRDQLKQLATGQIRRENLAAASFRELGKAAGIKASSVFYHFQSREQLLTELVRDYENEFFAQLDARTHGSDSPKQRLLALLDLFKQSQQQGKQCLCAAYAASSHELSDDSRAAVQQFFSRLEGWILEVLNKASLLPLPRETLAKVLLSSLEGALLIDRTAIENQHLDAIRQWINKLVSV